MTSHLSKSRKKNSMQVRYGLYCFFVDLAYLKESVENAVFVASFTQKKRNFQPRRK